MAEAVPVPPQYQPQQLVDFRQQEAGPRGFKVAVSKKGKQGTKRKLEEYAAQVEEEEQHAGMQQEAPAAPQPEGRVKKPKLDTTGVGKVSGRAWKQPAQRAGTLRGVLSSSWEDKMARKQADKAYREAKQAALAARKEVAQEARRRKKEAIARKEEARQRAEAAQTGGKSTKAKKAAKGKKKPRK